MIRPCLTLIAAGLLTTSGCASTDDLVDPGSSGTSQVTYAQVKAAPESYIGHPVTFGGKVLGAKRLKEWTRIKILQLPLTSSLKPTFDLTKSQGRFVARQKEFLDPATLPAGTFVTVIGEVAGSVILPIDEMEYNYPILEIKNVRIWTDDEELPRVRPYIGSNYYWGPYWSPYWPYYW